MSRKRPAWRITATDGLDAIVKIGPPPFSTQDIPATLLGKGRYLQQSDVIDFWIHAAADIPDGSQPAPFTFEQYAVDIVRRLTMLRRFEQEHPEHTWVVYEAIHAGWAMADAFWRLHRGRDTKTGRRRRAQSRQSGRQSGAVRKRTHDPIQKNAEAIRQRHPHSRKYSTRWLAGEIGRKLHLKPETVRKALRTLGRK